MLNPLFGETKIATRTKSPKAKTTKARYIGKPAGAIQERVKLVGPEHFGVVSVDCAKRRSKWMLCDFCGKVLIEPTSVEHTAGAIKMMTAVRFIPTTRRTTMTWKLSFMPRSKAMAWLPCRSMKSINRFKLPRDIERAVADIQNAVQWLPKSTHASEAKPIQEMASKNSRGPILIGDLLIPVLIRLGVVPLEEAKSNSSEARGSD